MYDLTIPSPLLIEVAGGITYEDNKVHTSGDCLLNHHSLGYGGIIQAMDVWMGIHHLQDKKFPEIRQGQSYLGGWGSPFCSIISAVWDYSQLKPTGLERRDWDNTHGSSPQHYQVEMSKSVSETDTVGWETKLDITDTITVGMEANLPGIGKGSASNSLSVGLSIGKSWSHTREVTAGVDDETDVTLDPGKAELVLLAALEGPMVLKLQLQTRWEGTFEYKFEGGHWQTMNLATLQERGLARPYDVGGIHNGIINMDLNFGTVSEVIVTSAAVTDTSSSGWDAAEAAILRNRWPDRRDIVLSDGPSHLL